MAAPDLGPNDLVALRNRVTAPDMGAGYGNRRCGYPYRARSWLSAPVEQRAAEFMRMLLDPRVRAIVPPWGGETAIDLIAHLDFDAIAAADPTWIVGYSDISTLLMSRLCGETDIATLVYIEAAGDEATAICRYLHGMRLAGFFDGAAAVLVGRTGAKDSPTLTQLEAGLDALGTLGLPIIGNVECGHVPPQLPIVNGALGRLVFTETEQYLQQSLR
ncbi:LD-carboxypeptidase [Cryobacterium sp. TMT1-66-1]|uniref:LD-carboxypeptidase n=1 Tax=Cryobacterium sp. TMT1-66-1 TaxID=1259242 RepID=UPI001F544242|nr:LD-carboxypeptidase [Cryobacterium sp. TMT1-66-1]